MGHWDYHALELLPGDTPEQVLAALPPTHGFHANGVFQFRNTTWIHVGWSDANAVAYRALVRFCQDTGRRWITSYATDLRAELDADFFGYTYPDREERLRMVFGPSEEERDQTEYGNNEIE